MNKVNTRVVLSFIIGTLLSFWGYLIALLHLGYMQAQNRSMSSIFDISSLNHSLIQLTCPRLTYLNEGAAASVTTIFVSAFEAATMDVRIENVVCSQ